MVKRIGTSRSKSRSKLSKDIRSRGKLPITRYMQSFKIGDKVALKAEPSVQKGLYHIRFHGKQGIVKDKLKNCYKITIMDQNKEKTITVHPVHLKRL